MLSDEISHQLTESIMNRLSFSRAAIVILIIFGAKHACAADIPSSFFKNDQSFDIANCNELLSQHSKIADVLSMRPPQENNSSSFVYQKLSNGNLFDTGKNMQIAPACVEICITYADGRAGRCYSRCAYGYSG